jgi:5-methylcytosine-specific restriction endonuclease McrA
MSPYGRAYKKRRLVLLRGGTYCWRCGRPIDETTGTIDHVPALTLHEHVERSGCCDERPACQRCNYGEGGRIGGRRVHAKRRARVNAWPARADEPW